MSGTKEKKKIPNTWDWRSVPHVETFPVVVRNVWTYPSCVVRVLTRPFQIHVRSNPLPSGSDLNLHSLKSFMLPVFATEKDVSLSSPTFCSGLSELLNSLLLFSLNTAS